MDQKPKSLKFYIVWLLLILFNLALLRLLYPLLPDLVAIHFDHWGRPNNWTSKADYARGVTIFTALINLLLLFCANFAGKKITSKWINIPYKKYWFSTPALQEKAAGKIENLMAATGVFFNLTTSFVIYIVAMENGVPIPRFALGPGIFVFLVLTALFLFGVFAYMKPPPKADQR